MKTVFTMARIRAFIGYFELKNQMTCTEKDLLSLINSSRQVIVAKKTAKIIFLCYSLV